MSGNRYWAYALAFGGVPNFGVAHRETQPIGYVEGSNAIASSISMIGMPSSIL